MATKRNQRIDPNDAFKAIVGQGGPAEEAPAAPPPAAPPIPQQNIPAQVQPVAVPQPEQETAGLKLVQKGYYITEEQSKKLGVYAALNGLDRSSIVRDALDMYFEANKNNMNP